jgi:hypothetical protein
LRISRRRHCATIQHHHLGLRMLTHDLESTLEQIGAQRGSVSVRCPAPKILNGKSGHPEFR